jgi:hypothetical protein
VLPDARRSLHMTFGGADMLVNCQIQRHLMLKFAAGF